MNRRIQTLFVLLFILFATGCGGGSNKAKKAQVAITNYTTKAENSKSPTTEDYRVAGFSAVSESNVDRVNSLLIEMPSDNVDTFEEIKVVIDELLNNDIPPKIVILGANPITQNEDSTYEDLGATASDDRDGNITGSIHVISDVNSSKEGNYTVTYSVVDSAGNKEVVIREVNIVEDTNSTIVTPNNPDNNDTKDPAVSPVTPNNPDNNDTKEPIVSPENNNTQIIIENAEDGNISRWHIHYDHSKTAKIENIDDKEKGSRIIFLDGNEREVGFLLGGSWDDTKSKIAQWSMKTDEEFLFRFIIETSKGQRYIEYNDKDTGTGKFSYKNKHYLRHGLGSESINGKWNTYTRDIDEDLKRYEPNNKLIKIKGIFVRGNVSLDDIIFYNSSEKLSIEKSVEVSAPGLVLTFDDSYVDNWSKIMPYFEENGVVATFFCHKWGSIEKGDLTKAEVATLQQFKSDGNEIGYHTKDHVGTRDTKYDKYITIEDKANAYFEDQIDSGVRNMRTRGFEPESFSYPYISGQPVHNNIIKKTLPHIREFFADVVLMDENVPGSKTVDEIKLHLDKFKENKEIGVLLGHWIGRPENKTDHSHQTTLERLKKIIEYAKSIDLKFYTLEEAHNIYLNQ